MKVSILCPDLSSNCLGRAYLLTKIIQRRYDVEIVGPIFGKEIWDPVAGDTSVKFKYQKIKGELKPYRQLCAITKMIDGDILYASKPLITSFGLGLLRKKSVATPLLLDIDDWEMGFIHHDYSKLSPYLWLKSMIYSAIHLYAIGSYWGTYVSEKFVRFATDITVSNSFLQSKFGGTLVPHGRDTDVFNPDNFNNKTLKKKIGINPSKKIIMFLGTVRPYKGVEDLIEAMELIADRNTFLILVGIDEEPYCKNLVLKAEKKLPDRFKGFGTQPFRRIPEFLSIADVVVIPQRDNIATRGQVPAKVFDAMAMAKPIVATKVSDLPKILNRCGWVVEPQEPKQLAAAITSAINQPNIAIEMGKKARTHCIEKYSWNAIEKELFNILQKYERM